MFQVLFKPIEKENVAYYQSKDFKNKLPNDLPHVLNDRIIYLICCYKWHLMEKDPIKKISKHPNILNKERKKLINYQFSLWALSLTIGVPTILDFSNRLRLIGIICLAVNFFLLYNNDYFNNLFFYDKKSDLNKYLDVNLDRKEIKRELLKYNIRV